MGYLASIAIAVGLSDHPSSQEAESNYPTPLQTSCPGVIRWSCFKPILRLYLSESCLNLNLNLKSNLKVDLTTDIRPRSQEQI